MNLKNFLKFVRYAPRNFVCMIIKGYQKTLSPDHGIDKGKFPYGYCRYYPTCSQYSYEVIKKYGVIWGGIKAIWRIIRCNPWSKGGVDLP